MSRQTDYQDRKRAAGLCTKCGKRPLHPDSKCHCWYCGTKARVRYRRKNGQQRSTFKITRMPQQSDLQAA